jgi:DNA-binding NarL/FixJ family response regulator
MVQQASVERLTLATEELKVKVLIADEHALMREALTNALADLGRPVTVLEADSLQAALAHLAAHPDTALVLVDLQLSDASDANVLARLRATGSKAPIVVVSAADKRATVLAALAGGAAGFISKRSNSAVLMGALRLVLAGGAYVPSEVLREEMASPRQPDRPEAPAAAHWRSSRELGLTPRQMDVLVLLVQGKPTKVISRQLNLATGTVKTHTAAIFRALGVANRTEAVFAVSRLGIQLPPAMRDSADAGHASTQSAGNVRYFPAAGLATA